MSSKPKKPKPLKRFRPSFRPGERGKESGTVPKATKPETKRENQPSIVAKANGVGHANGHTATTSPPRLPEEDNDQQTTKRGRPSLYKPEYARMAAAHAKLGATDAQLADLFGVRTNTIIKWRSQYPEFNKALKETKDAFDQIVERSLAQRAVGYSADILEAKVLADGAVVHYWTRKHFPPDVTACIFWLKNRQPGQWRDRHELTGANSGPIQVLSLDTDKLQGMSPEQLAVLEQALLSIGGSNGGLEEGAQKAQETGDAEAYAKSLM